MKRKKTSKPKVPKRISKLKKVAAYSLAALILGSLAQSYVKAETSELEAKLNSEPTEQVKAGIINVSDEPATTDTSLIKGNEHKAQLEPQGEAIPSKPSPSTPKAVKAPARQDKEQLAHAIYGLESSFGMNDGCKRDGLFNGYGYGQNKAKGKWTCFSSHEEAKEAVLRWITKYQDMGFSTPTLLCYYNTGEKVSDCPYYQDYKQLIEI